MNPPVVGILGMVFLVAMFLTGMPIAFAMALVGFLGFSVLVSWNSAIQLVAQDVFKVFSYYPFTMIAMFVLMGCFAFSAGTGKKLFRMAYIMLGHMRGGLTIAAIAACTAFGAVCGSATATSATIGKVALPEMKRYSYNDSLATGCIAVSGGLGILIPPSLALAVYGILTEQSIAKLFIAGVFPGLVLAALLIVTIWVMCRLNPSLGPPGPRTTWKQKAKSLPLITDTLILFVVALGGLFSGLFGPTQAGAVGTAGALLIGAARRESWHKFWEATKDALQISCMVMLLIAGGTIFGHFITVSKIPEELARYIVSLGLSPIGIMAMVGTIWFIGGCFIESMALLLMLLPVVYPLIVEAGWDPIWFGVFQTALGIIALVTPPVGLNAYVTQGIAEGVSLETVFRGIIPLLIPLTVFLVLLIAFPQIATFLPRFITY